MRTGTTPTSGTSEGGRSAPLGPWPASTSGGALLRALRERAGRPQLWVEAEADLGTGYLQRVECGRVAQPGRGTVERILAALGIPFGERRDVLALFGYAAANPLPTDAELAWARETSREDLAAVEIPAYVLDCAHRLVAWNAYVPRLFGVTGPTVDGSGVIGSLMACLAGRSMLAPWFDPTSPLAALVAEPERFRSALIRALRFEMQAYRSEAWYARMLDGLRRDLPAFRAAWECVEREPGSAGAARLREPMAFRSRRHGRDDGLLRFRLSSEPFVRDSRFRTIYYVPADAPTMRRCAAWAAPS